MSVVIKREHPSGEVGVSVAGFFDDNSVVLGMGPLKDMKFFKLAPTEARDLQDAIDGAIDVADGN